MAVPSFVAGGTTSGGSTSVTPGYPAIAAGDYIYMVVVTRAGGTIVAPGGTWVEVFAPFTLSSGMTASLYRVVATGSETGTQSVTITSGDSSVGRMVAYRSTTGSMAEVTASGADTTSGTAYSATSGSVTSQTDDRLVYFTALNDNSTSSVRTIDQANATEGTAANRFDAATATGLDCKVEGNDVPITSGGTGAITATLTSSTAVTGVTAFLLLRETSAVTGTGAASATAGTSAAARWDRRRRRFGQSHRQR